MSTDCIWRGTDEPRALRHRHDTDGCIGDLGVPDETCRGCVPCPHTHCVLCGIEHVDEQTCPLCISGVRDSLIEVRNLYAQLPHQALYGGGDGKLEAARPIPGGEAMALMGPASSGKAAVWARERGDDVSHLDDERKGDIETPTMALSTWEWDWRCIRNQRTEDLVTLYSAADYLDEHLHWAAQHHDAFDAFAADLRSQVAKLEDVLHAGDRDDTGAPCLKCGGTQVKEWGATVVGDRWVCKRCKQPSSPFQYRQAVREEHRKVADRLNATDMVAEYDITQGGLTGWVSKGKVKRRGKDTNGRQLYDVEGVKKAIKERDENSEDVA